MHDSDLTSFPSTSSVSRTSRIQRSIQFPDEVQRCAVCNATLCFDLLASWATTCKRCNRIACMIERAATQPQTAVPTTNREPTTPPCCRYCMRRFEDEARRCNTCTGIMCHSCNPSEAWLCGSCRELKEPQDADKIACAHCQKVRIQCNHRCSQCSQYVCEECEHDPFYIWGRCRKDEQYERRCWTKTGAASSSKDTSAIREKDESVNRQKRTTESTAEFEDADVEMTIAVFITQEAASSTGALTLVPAPEETQSDANSRGSRRVISTEVF